MKDESEYGLQCRDTDRRYEGASKRSGYYQGMIDLNLIEKGEPYRKLNRSYVIFICTFDPFGEGLYRYTFENLCKEQKDISLNDEAVKLFFNTTGTKGEVTGEARAFLKYVGGMASEDAYIKELQEKIEAAKRNEEWRARVYDVVNAG